MLSGMNPKIQDRYQKEIDEWLAKGNTITVIPSKFSSKHTTRTKSHMRGGKHSRFNIGGNKWKARKSA